MMYKPSVNSLDYSIKSALFLPFVKVLTLSALTLSLFGCGGDDKAPDLAAPQLQTQLMSSTYSPFDTITFNFDENLVSFSGSQCNKPTDYFLNWVASEASKIKLVSLNNYAYTTSGISQFKGDSLVLSCTNIQDAAGNVNNNFSFKAALLPIVDSDLKLSATSQPNDLPISADTLALNGTFNLTQKSMRDSLVIAGYILGNKNTYNSSGDYRDYYLIQAKAGDSLEIKLYGVKNATTLEFSGPKKIDNTLYQLNFGDKDTAEAGSVALLKPVITADRQFQEDGTKVEFYKNYWIQVHVKDLNTPLETPYRLMIRRLNP